MAPANYTPEEEDRIVEALRSDDRASCPRCRAPLDRTEVPARGDVAYVRRRLWLVCGACRRSLVVDRRRLNRP